MLRHGVVGLLLLAGPVAGAETPAAKPARIATEILAQRAPLVGLKLSPDGQKVLGRRGTDERLLAVRELATGKLQTLSVSGKSEVVWYRWAGNDRLLVSIGRTVPYMDEAYMTRLVVFDLASNSPRFIGKSSEGLEGDDVLYVDPRGEWLLLSIQKTIYHWPSVYRVDLATGAMTEVVRQQSDVWEWYADSEGVVRVGTGLIGKSWFMVYRASATEKFRRVLKVRSDDDDAVYDALRIVQGSDQGYVLSNKKTGRYALYRFNFATRELGDLMFESRPTM